MKEFTDNIHIFQTPFHCEQFRLFSMDISAQIILCRGGLPRALFRFRLIPGPDSLDASSTPPPGVVTTRMSPDAVQCPAVGAARGAPITPPLRTTGLGGEDRGPI